MGAYNASATIREALDSIIAQTYPNWEVVVCDDGSQDDTLEILSEYAGKDSRIRAFQNEHNMGLAATLNHCLEYACGAYIARMDSDDLSTADRFEKQVAFLEQHPEYEVVGSFVQAFDEDGMHHIIACREHPTRYDLPKGSPFEHGSIMMRASAMRALNGYRISEHTVRTEDADLWYRFYAAGFKGANIAQPLYCFRLDDAAYKRRKLKYMVHAAYIVWDGCNLLGLPFYYKIYCLKPILSWLLPRKLKNGLRKWVIR